MVSLSRISAIVYLLLSLYVTGYLSTNGHVLTEDAGNTAPRPETTSLQGKIRGVNMLTRNNRTIYGFKGIPFAEPPIGSFRFKAPVAARSWNGTFDASKDSNLCPYPPKNGISSGISAKVDEDCLYLHVYTPKLPANDNSTLLPVMVFIFGGQFIAGTNNPEAYGPNFLLDKDVVLVVPSYRLGVLGFLTTGDEASPGNYGLKDMVMALEWNRDNIKYFGGDPDRVTIFGSSTGAMSVGLLALSNSTNGLFHQYIMQSGTALTMELSLPSEVYVNRTIRLGEHFGCPTNASALLVDCLRGLSFEKLVDTEKVFYENEWFPTITWFPTVEPDIEGAFLTETPEKLFATGKIRDLPSIFLCVRDEALVLTERLYINMGLFEDLLNDIDYTLPRMLGYFDPNHDNKTTYNTALKSYYLNNLSADRNVLLNNYTELLSDGLWFYPIYATLQHRLVYTKSPVYFCSFEYRGLLSNTYDLTGGLTNYTSIAHGDDLIYLFEDVRHHYGPPDYTLSDVDWSMVDIMVELWTSFATNGIPTIEDSNGTFAWDRYSKLNNYLRIGNGINNTGMEMEYDLHIEHLRYWKELLANEINWNN